MTDIQPAIDVLNEALELDTQSINFLFSRYAPANQKLIDHSTIQIKADSNNHGLVGLLGIINGILDPLAGDRVCAVYNDENPDTIVRFGKYSDLIKFPDQKKI